MGALIGSAIAYAFRLPPIKLCFNLAQLALVACVAVVILPRPRRTRRRPRADDLDRAVRRHLATGALTIACIAGAIAITEGGMSRRTLGQMFAMDFVVTATNSSIAIAAALVVATDPRAAPVLLVPALSVFALYRAYVSERQRHEQLEFLYEANRTSRAPRRSRRRSRASSPAPWRLSAARSRRSSCSAPTGPRCGPRTGPARSARRW